MTIVYKKNCHVLVGTYVVCTCTCRYVDVLVVHVLHVLGCSTCLATSQHVGPLHCLTAG